MAAAEHAPARGDAGVYRRMAGCWRRGKSRAVCVCVCVFVNAVCALAFSSVGQRLFQVVTDETCDR